jgi:hypothetical protein
MEYLFQSVRPIVIKHAEQQLKRMFSNSSTGTTSDSIDYSTINPLGPVSVPAPDEWITVHIRWGDKKIETPLLPIETYTSAVRALLNQKERSGKSIVHIYLATEDPIAEKEFREKASKESPPWQVHTSGPSVPKDRQGILNLAQSSQGLAGLESLAALLVALQGNRYVLGSGSNWSRLIDEIHSHVLDPRCGNCTQVLNVHNIVHGQEHYGEF